MGTGTVTDTVTHAWGRTRRHAFLDHDVPGRPGLGASRIVLLSITEVPSDLRTRMGGLVASRSVKYLGRLHTKVSTPQSPTKAPT